MVELKPDFMKGWGLVNTGPKPWQTGASWQGWFLLTKALWKEGNPILAAASELGFTMFFLELGKGFGWDPEVGPKDSGISFKGMMGMLLFFKDLRVRSRSH